MCCCGGAGPGGSGDTGSSIDVRTTKFDPLLAGAGDGRKYDGKTSNLWVGGQADLPGDISAAVDNAAWWGRVIVVVAGTAATVWIVHRIFFDKR
jgi:hypothetical protein